MARSVDRDEWKFGPVSGPVCGGLAAATLAVAEPVAHYPGWFPAGVAGVVGAASMAIAVFRKKPLGLWSYRSVSWIAAGAWTSWTAAGGWSWVNTAALVGGGLVTFLAAPVVQEIDESDDVDGVPARNVEGRTLAPAELVVKAAVDDMLRLPAPGAEMLGFHTWDTGSGYTIVMELPADTGYGEDQVQEIVVRLARRLRLPLGCLPLASEGDYQGQVILRVPTRDDLSMVIDFPRDYRVRSVNEEQQIGVYGDGSPVMVEVRESSALIAGRKGGGKTNTVDVFGANYQLCDDVLICDIDLNGGGMSVPWMLPFVQDESIEEPPIFWPAPTPEEALLMSEVLLGICLDRKARYGKLAAQANSRLVPMSPAIPEIKIRIDEAAEVLGETSPYKKLRDNLMAIHRMGRAVGVTLDLSSLRATGDHIPVQARKNCATRIATKVGEDQELYQIFDYERGLKSGMLKTRGEVFVYRGDPEGTSVVRKAKILNLLPDQIGEIVRATWDRRPRLDEAGERVGNAEYRFKEGDEWRVFSNILADRWDRLMPWLEALAAGGDVEEEPAAGPRYDPPPMTTQDAMAAYEESRARVRVESVKIASADEIEREFLSIIGDQREPATVGGPASPTLRDRVDTVARIVRDAGEEGIMRADIIAALKDRGIDVQDATVSEWLKKADEEGLVRRGAKKGLWLSGEGQ